MPPTDPKDAAQAEAAHCGVERGQIYRHYKGGLYSIVDVAVDEATLAPLVVYRGNVKGATWVRTLRDFDGSVSPEPGRWEPRFVREPR